MAQEMRIVECAPVDQITIQQKNLLNQQTEVEMELGAYYVPKDKSLKPLGEDAYFIGPEGQSFGVADGVGGWTKRGIDAGEYARQLMENSKSSIMSQPKGCYIDPKEVLLEAHSRTKVPGSSTACLVTLTGQVLYYASIGDSGFMILRKGRNIYKSIIKQRRFNAPCHLGNGGRFTPPCEAIEGKIKVIPGDIIVAATDGLFDNMFEREIERTVKKIRAQGANPQNVAETLVKLALYNSMDECFESPFSKAADEAGQEHQGGKRDDITVVVGFIQPQSELDFSHIT
ncbi:hypothetical protein V2J09_023965 [Rumex salicifolius]